LYERISGLVWRGKVDGEINIQRDKRSQ